MFRGSPSSTPAQDRRNGATHPGGAVLPSTRNTDLPGDPGELPWAGGRKRASSLPPLRPMGTLCVPPATLPSCGNRDALTSQSTPGRFSLSPRSLLPPPRSPFPPRQPRSRPTLAHEGFPLPSPQSAPPKSPSQPPIAPTRTMRGPPRLWPPTPHFPSCGCGGQGQLCQPQRPQGGVNPNCKEKETTI